MKHILAASLLGQSGGGDYRKHRYIVESHIHGVEFMKQSIEGAQALKLNRNLNFATN